MAGSGSSDLTGEPDCSHWEYYSGSGTPQQWEAWCSGSGSGYSGSGSGSGYSGSGSGSEDDYIDLYPAKKCGCDCGGNFEDHVRYGFANKRKWDKNS
tara:strand:+ start:713 stop:1003 length:291 start_codon:yes stop_codon:yes gene_type:complete